MYALGMRQTRYRVSSIALAVLAAGSLAGCGDDAAAPVDSMVTPDGSIDASAGPPDAMGPCPGALHFTGEYVDWDSTLEMFDGVEFATFTEVGNAQNTAMSAPNGRATLCLPRDVVSAVSVTQADYLDLMFVALPEVTALGPFSIKGLTPGRAGELLGLIGLTPDPGRAHVLVSVREQTGGEPAVGAGVSLDASYEDALVMSADGAGDGYQAGTTLVSEEDAYVLFANVDIAAGMTAVSVTDPERSCMGAGALPLTAGTITATALACTAR